MASTDAHPVPQKNVAYRITFPILDADGDLVTGAAGLDSEVSKDAGTFADCTNEATEIATNSGMYYLDLTNTEMNADTVAIIVKTSTSGAKTTPIVLYPEEAGDIRVNVTQLNGTGVTGRDIGASVLLSTGTGTGQLDFTSGVVKANVTQFNGSNATSASGIPEVKVASIAANAITATSIAADAITAAKIADGAIDAATFAAGAINAAAIASDAITAAKIADGAIDAATFAAGAIDATAIAANAIGASELAADAVTEIQAGLSTLDAAGVRTAVGLASANLDTQLSTIDDFLDTEVAAIKAKTDQLTFTNPNSVDATATIAAAAIRSAVGLASANLDTQLGAIDDFLDTEVAAIKAKTDSLTFTVAGQLDANIQSVNDVTVNGVGSAGNPWGP